MGTYTDTLKHYCIACQCQITPLWDIYTERFGEKTDGFFVEVGAFNGLNWSNTWPLAKIGWGGLCIEPHPELYGLCVKTYKDIPKVKSVRWAIGDKCITTRLYTAGSMSTTTPEMLDLWKDITWVQQTGIRRDKFVHVEQHTLDCALGMQGVPHDFDILVVDVEGGEDAVLATFDKSPYRPRMAIIELDIHGTQPYVMKKVALVREIMKSAGYETIHSDAINTIFWRTTPPSEAVSSPVSAVP